ncbi:uncharacterized protein LOC133825451 [Humulus lupulus]|uniref:uncharacterized protein LOC133825451 n=1 Tax=Humulus lupulus TaxID=3486 RepID=UPI002B40AF91|nr:uncharacterized protein LOC133825451 [Humulus lupulus]
MLLVCCAFLRKLNRLKYVLHKFNKVKVGDVSQLFSTAKEKYQQAQFNLQQDPSSADLQQAAYLEFALQSKILKQRKVGNLITLFMDDKGQLVDNYEDVVAHFINNFKSFMGSPSPAITQLKQDCFTHGATLNLDQKLGLIKPFTKKDVMKSLFSIHSIKSPGSDGYGSGFFKVLW